MLLRATAIIIRTFQFIALFGYIIAVKFPQAAKNAGASIKQRLRGVIDFAPNVLIQKKFVQFARKNFDPLGDIRLNVVL